jgi:membrane protein
MKKTPSTNAKPSNPLAVKQTAVKGVTSILAWITKFNNDWVLSFASGLAFNLMTALIPIIIAIVALAGFIYGGLNPAIQEELIQHIQSNFPPPLPSQEIIGLALTTLNQGCCHEAWWIIQPALSKPI